MGMFNFERDFVPNLAEKSGPMQSLLKKNIMWSWSSEQDKAFDDVKQIISEATVLTIINYFLKISKFTEERGIVFYNFIILEW